MKNAEHTLGGGAVEDSAGGGPLGTLLPPVIAGAAEGLHHAVHRLAEEDGDLFVLAPVLVRPGADDEQTAFGTEVEALL